MVLLILFHFVVASYASNIHFQGAHRLPVEYRESIHPLQVVSDEEEQPSQQVKKPIEYTIRTPSNESFQILLEPREDVRPYIAIDNGEHLIKLNERQLSQCHYSGKFKNGKGKVVMDTCNGLKGVLVDEHKNIFFVEPAGNGLHNLTSYSNPVREEPLPAFHDPTKEERHTKRTRDDVRTKQKSEKSNYDKDVPASKRSDDRIHLPHYHPQKRDLNWGSAWEQGVVDERNGAYFNLNKVTKFISTAYVIDNSMYNYLGRDMIRIFNFVNTISNYVNMLYAPAGFKFAITNFLVWVAEDKIDLRDANNILYEFENYDRLVLKEKYGWKHDYSQLLTHKFFGLAGKSSFASMCKWDASGLVYAWTDNPYKLAGTVAHELGHALGLDHYSTGRCHCPSRAPCVMTYINSHDIITDLTDCSKEQLVEACKDGLCSCLLDPPKSVYNSGTCGNGFIEEGEDCDCGDIVSCKNKCCDPVTCKMVAKAQCAHGKCCSKNCMFKKAGTTCRKGISACDKEEMCTGSTAECPVDVGFEDYMPCNDNQGYCYGAACIPTLDIQCKRIWGRDANFGGEGNCYDKGQSMNTWGIKYGHCGRTLDRGYIPCAPSDERCGKLQCYGRFSGRFVLIGRGRMTTEYSYDGNKCRAGTTYVVGAPDPTMPLDGTKCGDGKVCRHHRCVDVSTQRSWHMCRDACKHGFCTQLGLCNCRAGYGGPTCSVADKSNKHGNLYYPSCYGKCNTGACNVITDRCWCPPGRGCPDCKHMDPLNTKGKLCSPVQAHPGFGGSSKGISCGTMYKGSFFKNGCYHRIGQRYSKYMPKQILNGRNQIVWSDFHRSTTRLICSCAHRAKNLGYRSFGLQFWGECWGSMIPGEEIPKKMSGECRNTEYRLCSSRDVLCVGTEHSTVLYTLSD